MNSISILIKSDFNIFQKKITTYFAKDRDQIETYI